MDKTRCIISTKRTFRWAWQAQRSASLAVLLVIAAGGLSAWAEDESAEQFFTGLADRLLRQKFPFGATNIPVAPTNQYSPAVHRLLQVTANLYECTRTNRFPCVFRPLFGSNAAGTIITGFTNDNRRSTLDAYLAAENRYGIPLVIGAKKGFPNFNEYTLRTDIQVARKLELLRRDTNSLPYQTNQMYVLGISNLFGMEAWNSYSVPYSNQLTLEARNLVYVSLTNRAGLFHVPTVTSINYGPMMLPADFWQGGQFKLPLFTNVMLMTNSVYRFAAQTFEPLGVNNLSDRGNGFPLPEWFLTISNRTWFILSEGDTLVDFFMSHNLVATMDIDYELLRATALQSPTGISEDDVVSGLWDTNRLNGATDDMTPTRGIMRQLNVSFGNETVSDAIWHSYNAFDTGENRQFAIDKFRVFCGLTPLYYTTNAPRIRRLDAQAPFCPTRKLVRTTTWQANDPLVHTHLGDLLVFPSNAITEAMVPPIAPIPTNSSLATLGLLNRRYSPWGGNPTVSEPGNPGPREYGPAVKDPGVWTADDWDFPTGQPLDLAWIGRVHRGTPWQTIYLKHTEPEADESDWRELSADFLWYPPPPADQRSRYVRTHPTNDWALASLLAGLWNTIPPQQRVSINSRDPAAWAVVWDGVTVLSNNLADEILAHSFTNLPPTFATFVMASNSPQAAVLSAAVNRDRSLQPGGCFRDLADILTVPELSAGSPWLNLSTAIQRRLGLSDAALEAIPAQVLSRLRADPVGSITRQGSFVTFWFYVGDFPAYEVEVSTDLQDWAPLSGTVTQTNGWAQMTEPIDRNAGSRFFRARLLP